MQILSVSDNLFILICVSPLNIVSTVFKYLLIILPIEFNTDN
jgi:hypothetical protein